MNSTLRSLLFWVFLIVVAILVWQFSVSFQRSETVISFTEFLRDVEKSNVKAVTISGNEIIGEYVTLSGPELKAKTFRTYAPLSYDGLANFLDQQNVKITARQEARATWASLLLTWAPILLMVGFFIFVMRQMQSGGNKALSFGKSRAKLSSSTQKKVTFKDVAGCDEAKEELKEIVEFHGVLSIKLGRVLGTKLGL
ncbi:ATP-dependent metallopeptidase FtsH/Yme1/Tma family protein [uncultured Arthrobacter sp.]|uniref:ATP-dependent metallopeptidase FtsH/Yme1/Tma family protein n=1 Tax=uncultured Arthrobacter sp. TaxID=114050 RepID=UPI0032169F0B